MQNTWKLEPITGTPLVLSLKNFNGVLVSQNALRTSRPVYCSFPGGYIHIAKSSQFLFRHFNNILFRTFLQHLVASICNQSENVMGWFLKRRVKTQWTESFLHQTVKRVNKFTHTRNVAQFVLDSWPKVNLTKRSYASPQFVHVNYISLISNILLICFDSHKHQISPRRMDILVHSHRCYDNNFNTIFK